MTESEHDVILREVELAVERSGSSPFDVITLTDDRGEWWSARELMHLMAYDKWERFEDVIDRARIAITNSGHDADVNASRLREAIGKTQRINYRLTRYGAYMAAMNGDPRKKAVSEAQTYFAVKAREAETAPAVLPDISTSAGVLAMAEQFAQTARQLVAVEARNVELEPKAEAFDTFMTADGDYLIGTVAKMLGLGQNTLFARLRDEHVLISGGKRHNTPQQQYMKHFRVVIRTFTDEDGGSHASYTTYVKPSGVDWIRKVLKMTDLSLA